MSDHLVTEGASFRFAHDAIQSPSTSYSKEESCTSQPQTVTAPHDSSIAVLPTAHALLSPDPAIRGGRFQELLEVQRALESESLAQGAKNFRKRLERAELKGRGSTMGAAKKLLTHGITPTEDAITFFIADQKKKRGVKHCSVKWIEAVGVEVAAYMAIRAILDHIGQRPSVKDVAAKISELMVDELRYRRFEEKAPGLFRYKMNSFTTSSYVHMARSLSAAIRQVNIDVSDLAMSPTHKVLVGAKLIDLVTQATQLITVETTTKVMTRRRKATFTRELLIVPTEETVAFMRKRNEILEFLSPVLMPMVVPPLQWEPGRRGGYRFALRNKSSLVRGSPEQSKHAEHAENTPMVFQSVNAIQNTPWRINTAVYDLVKHLESIDRLDMAKVIDEAPEEEPSKPADIDDNEQARKQYRRAKHQWIEKQRAKANRILEFDRVMQMAERMKDYEAIFFPHNMDFRGRIYPISHFLTPQGDQLQKGLLKFATGKPLGPMGSAYLALHGMNCLDKTPEGQKVKRMTLDERVQYIVDHSAEICAAANDPLGYQWWASAEKPLQFYAFCIEWNGFMQMEREGRGTEYVCSLPVSIDGSCNGLQHFSAMLKDPVGAKAVNVAANSQPEDVYDRIADSVKNKLEALAAGEGPEAVLARVWLSSGLISRELTKRPTMTFSYGSKMYGFQEQLVEFMKEPKRWPKVKHLFVGKEQDFGPSIPTNSVVTVWETSPGGAVPREKDRLNPMCSLMARLIWSSLAEVVVAAFAGMEWMQNTARLISQTGKPIEWTVPITGFRVRQEYYKMKQREINTILAGRVIKPRINEQTKEILLHKQANAVSPNVVHSLDAAGLMLSITAAAAEGVEMFSAVHDSYGSLPADMEIIWTAARQSFVRLYTNHDVIGDLAQQFQQQAPEGKTIPPVPPVGTLDVNAVLVSDYFFC